VKEIGPGVLFLVVDPGNWGPRIKEASLCKAKLKGVICIDIKTKRGSQENIARALTLSF
jgi:hypothetical protein